MRTRTLVECSSARIACTIDMRAVVGRRDCPGMGASASRNGASSSPSSGGGIPNCDELLGRYTESRLMLSFRDARQADAILPQLVGLSFCAPTLSPRVKSYAQF